MTTWEKGRKEGRKGDSHEWHQNVKLRPSRQRGDSPRGESAPVGGAKAEGVWYPWREQGVTSSVRRCCWSKEP